MANASESKPLLTSQPNDDDDYDEEAVDVWIIGWTRRNREIFVNDDRIILFVSQCLNSPSLLTDGCSLLHPYGSSLTSSASVHMKVKRWKNDVKVCFVGTWAMATITL